MNYHVRKLRNNSLIKNGKIEKDFTSGPIFKQILLFAIPLLFTNVLQVFFNTADVLVLGALVGDTAVAAVGSTGSLVNLIVSLVIGLSIGVNVVGSKRLGENDEEGVRKVVGMSIVLSLVLGLVLLLVGWFGSKFFLTLMKSDVEVIDLSTTYLKVYFLGVPLVILYNFLSAIMCSAGDSKRPLIYLLISGTVNVILNVFFIVVVKLTVEGVAIATVVSQGLSALLCIIRLSKAEGAVQLKLKHIKFYKEEFLEIARIGLPSGLQGSLFSLSNVFIQSTVNMCGKFAMAGSSYAIQIEAYVYCAMNSVSKAVMTFVSQNYGAKKYDRIFKIIKYSTIISVIVGLSLGTIGTLISKPLLGLIADSSEIVDYAFRRVLIICLPYFLCGVMEVLSYSMRALGKSFMSMIISLLGSCVLRIIWVNVMFSFFPSYDLIFVSYPATWIITCVILFAFLSKMLKELKVQAGLQQ